MGIMFLSQAALLCIQLSVMWHVFAVDLRNMTVTRGGSVVFICNTSNRNTTQVSWTKSRSFFSHAFLLNQTFSNFSSNRVTIYYNLPTKLSVTGAQPEDAGLYTCTVNSGRGVNCIKWNLTVSEGPKEIRPSLDLVYILAPVIGLFLCGMLALLCLCRKYWTRTPNQDPDQDQHPPQSGGEVPLRQGGTGRRTNKKGSQYKERLNSLYGHI